MDNHPVLFEISTTDQKPNFHRGKPRLRVPERNQISFTIGSIDELIPQDHVVRLVWDYVNQLDMGNILGTIQSVEGDCGRPAIDPKILMTLWLYATLEGIVSARTIADYCKEHLAFQWICGGVSVNHHTISDFSTKYQEQFDEFLIQSVTILLKQGAIDLEEIAQDGMRVRASAGGSSFRKEDKLSMCYDKAKQYLRKIREESKTSPQKAQTKKEVAAIRAATEREKKVKQAIEELKKLKEERKKNTDPGRLEETLKKAKSSTTDPEARRMKMANGGFNPAYNVQFATTKKGRVIVGVDVNNKGNDTRLIVPMLEQIYRNFGAIPSRLLVDTGYASYEDLTIVEERYKGCEVYMAPKVSGKTQMDPYKIRREDSLGIASWRKRMQTEEAKQIYKGRSSVAEFSNAQSRNKGLQQFLVRGLKKVKTTICRFAIAHNMQRYFSLRAIGA